MNNIMIWIFAIVIIGGGWFVFSNQGETETAFEKKGDVVMQESETKSEENAMEEKKTEVMKEVGSYELYSAEKFANATTGDVVLFFRASWCPTCRGVDADIRAHLGNIPPTLTILDIDYDTSASLKQKYGVTYQHTFVQVDAEGNLIKKWQGSPTLATLISEVK